MENLKLWAEIEELRREIEEIQKKLGIETRRQKKLKLKLKKEKEWEEYNKSGRTI